MKAACREGLLVDAHEPALTDGGRRLELRQRLGAPAEAEPLDAARNRAGGDDHDLAAAADERGDVGGERRNGGDVDCGGVVEEHGAPYLDDDAARVFDELSSAQGDSPNQAARILRPRHAQIKLPQRRAGFSPRVQERVRRQERQVHHQATKGTQDTRK